MFTYGKEFQAKPTHTFSRHSLNQRLAMASLLSLSALVFSHPALAAELGSQNVDTIVLNDGDKITADLRLYGLLYGVLNESSHTANISLANDVRIAAIDTMRSAGIDIRGNDSVLNGNRLTVEVKGSSVQGINISGQGAHIDLGSGSRVIAERTTGTSFGQDAGINITNASTLTANNLYISTSGHSTDGLVIHSSGTSVDLGQGSIIETNGTYAAGIVISNFSSEGDGLATLTANNLTIAIQGDSSTGISSDANTLVDLGSGSVITTSGQNSTGASVSGTMTADVLTIHTKGERSVALQATPSGVVNIGAGSHIYSERGSGIQFFIPRYSSLTDQRGIIYYLGTENNRNTIFAGGSYGVHSADSGKIKLAYTDINIEPANVDPTNEAGIALWASNRGEIIGDNLTIHGAAETYGVYAQYAGQIDLTGDTTIYMANPTDIAIATESDDYYEPSQINATGKMNIQGGILSRGGLINLDMQSGSQWNGRAYSDNVNGGALNITMTDSRWNMTADSNLDKLVLNNSTVDFSEDKVGSLLTVDALSGNGRFILRTDLVGDGVVGTGDKLVVTGESAGDHQLTVLNRGSLATTGHEVLTVVETQDGQATFTSTGKVELGGYLYDVRKNGTNWELYSSGIDGQPPNPSKPDPESPITSSADAGANFLNIGYLMNYAETQTLLQRMGSLRQNGKSGDMWLRGFAGKFDSFSGGKLSHFDMNYSGMQLGADKRVFAEVPLFAGLFIGQTHGKPNYRSGDGTTKSDSAGLYATYMANNGFYLDGVAKYSHIKNNFNVRDSQNNRVNGNGTSNGFSASLESGQKFSLNQPGHGWYIEPQAQLSYSQQGTSNLVASNGLKVNLGSYESIIGRASAVVGYELLQGDNSLNVYLKTGYLHEFSGDTDYRLNGSPESHSFKGGWWNNGVGVSALMNKKHTLYLDLDTSTGNKFNQRQINAGYRFSF
ncbi:P.93 [Pragia fontium]|uniref:autotransporter outer membrane beta-barrel domain-containing protein n=1 Tax=Pragia fontium TaxID=82985 RepID=UPI000DFD6BEF|nr:autotransporter outer membrane beta-barrel domain-containing protein [Pragia fontium]SUB82709.1 P.93 [Pragia fontium]